MQTLIDTVEVIFKILYLYLEALVLFFVPSSWRRKDVSGQICLITGAGSGLGRLMATKFAGLGCTLVLWDISEEGNKETARQIQKLGAKAYCYTCDLSDREAIYKAADQVKKDVGNVNILINNAGIVTGKKFMDCSDQLIQKTMEVNTMAHFWTVRSFLPYMLEKNHGHIVNIASSAGLCGVNGLADYCASKFGAVGFDESLRFELEVTGKSGVKTTVVCPYYINTGMFDGVKTKFPLILPILDQEYATDTIIDAVLTNKQILMMPRSLYLMMALKGVLPSSAHLPVLRFFGATESMDNFRGRNKKDT